MKTVIVDARRLLCPMPVIRVQNQVRELPAGTRVEAVCTDPGALNDIPAWCRINGHKLIETRTENNEYIIVVEVAGEN
ncbi:MAG: sulfurtransferase TusA family protein [Sedimenticola sp.]|uniref:Sulfurtransferase TusA family protein n=1 Tax=Sedimenticola thiotaurini TaxID=1543721 RepID=A0A558DFG0_9GAMM|nr:sulfurtransferase TusA family protein [Sedimenticola sp.]TVT59764.1 MAG: sulfurtransferase TusA family protein [Sedimenticola thiotaurini]MCW8880716.1 sulfurtransferase TusA family protein [Sedimenticola sp.]MCW8921625.1 sulfurtransferase TusA family protein [Sedimenticola sp.]MCW8947041.1 sulfurtransferase TusA family protein [Sedimenticola sp.]